MRSIVVLSYHFICWKIKLIQHVFFCSCFVMTGCTNAETVPFVSRLSFKIISKFSLPNLFSAGTDIII